MASRPECPTCEERTCKEWERCAREEKQKQNKE